MSVEASLKRNYFFLKSWFNNEGLIEKINTNKLMISNKDLALADQKNQLDKLMRYAQSNCEMYATCDAKSLSSFPIVNKKILNENFNKIVIPEKNVPGHKGIMHVQRTSGSTGSPFAAPQDYKKRISRLADLKFFGDICGYKSHDRLLQMRIWTNFHNKSNSQSFWENIFPVDCSVMSDQLFFNIVEMVSAKRIVAILGYSSWITSFIEFLEKNPHLVPKLKAVKTIFTCSEMLPESTKIKAKSILNCNVYSRYSNEEQGILGHEVPGRVGYFLNYANYYYEYLKLDSDEPARLGELARIVVTDLNNYAFPMIRYDTGDTGIFDCYESDNLLYLKEVYGRKLDVVYNLAGEPVHPMVLARILKNYNEIKQYQFIQKNHGVYVLKIILNAGYNGIPSDLLKSLKSTFGMESDFNVEYVDNIPVLKSGKSRPVICELYNA